MTVANDPKIIVALDRVRPMFDRIPRLPPAIGPTAMLVHHDYQNFSLWRVSDLVRALRQEAEALGVVDLTVNEIADLAPKIVEGTMMLVVEYEPDRWLVARALLDGAVVNAKGGMA